MASGLKAWLSSHVQDPSWDQFVGASSLGQFQQACAWAIYKQGEGWRAHRVVVTAEDRIVGGFQLLWKTVAGLRLGYVSKGPVVEGDITGVPELVSWLLDRATRDVRLSAVVVQAPDEATEHGTSPALPGLVEGNPMGVIDATYVVDLRGGLDQLNRRVHDSLHKGMRKARRGPIAVREGSREDLPAFFRLMATACERQGVAPNPNSVAAMERLWDAFRGSESLRLTLAVSGEEPFAGLLCVKFGNRLSQWKKGWDGSRKEWRANELLAYEAMEWGCSHGMQTADFCGYDRSGAERWLKGDTDPSLQRPRDRFNLRLGGVPVLLPRARILIPNPMLRAGYKLMEWARQRLTGSRNTQAAPGGPE